MMFTEKPDLPRLPEEAFQRLKSLLTPLPNVALPADDNWQHRQSKDEEGMKLSHCFMSLFLSCCTCRDREFPLSRLTCGVAVLYRSHQVH